MALQAAAANRITNARFVGRNLLETQNIIISHRKRLT
jgi:hypothetical protein